VGKERGGDLPAMQAAQEGSVQALGDPVGDPPAESFEGQEHRHEADGPGLSEAQRPPSHVLAEALPDP
jgi:hypothetical protein